MEGRFGISVENWSSKVISQVSIEHCAGLRFLGSDMVFKKCLQKILRPIRPGQFEHAESESGLRFSLQCLVETLGAFKVPTYEIY